MDKAFPGSYNANSIDDQAFIDLYALFRDVICPSVMGLELFKYFYYNKKNKILYATRGRKISPN